MSIDDVNSSFPPCICCALFLKEIKLEKLELCKTKRLMSCPACLVKFEKKEYCPICRKVGKDVLQMIWAPRMSSK